MGILRTDRVSGLGGANAITGSTFFVAGSGTSHGQYLRVEDLNGDFKFGTSDFTIEFWMNTPTVDTSDIGAESSLATMLDHGYGFSENASGAWWVLHHKDATLIWGFNGSNQLTTSSFIKVNTWHHIAVVRTGGNTKIYADGTQVGTVSDGQNYTDALTRPLDIGAQTYQTTYRNYEGFISNLRIINGTALYTSAFTPPTTRLTKTSDTVLLTCNSISDILHEETGKIITPNRNTISSSYATARRDTPNTPVGFSTTTDVGTQFGSTFDGVTTFDSQAYMVPPGGNTRERNRGRAIIAGGTNGSGWGTKLNTISFIQIQSGGITQDFGDLTTLRTDISSVSSSTRAVFGGGSEGAEANNAVNIMEFVTISTSSNVTDFGDLIDLRRPKGGVSNNIRGLFGGGNISPSNKSEIDHVVIATAGNATDFGDLLVSGTPNEGSSNSTRGVWMGGGWGVQIEIVTIASTGSSTDFGNLGNNRGDAAGASSTTRALCAGGGSADTDITFIEFATLGNDSVFGDLTQGRRTQHGTSNALRGIFCGGYTPDYNIIDAVTIATTGNAVDFGDLTTATREPDACSDSHGGVA